MSSTFENRYSNPTTVEESRVITEIFNSHSLCEDALRIKKKMFTVHDHDPIFVAWWSVYIFSKSHQVPVSKIKYLQRSEYRFAMNVVVGGQNRTKKCALRGIVSKRVGSLIHGPFTSSISPLGIDP